MPPCLAQVRERALTAIDKAKGHYSTAFHYMAARREQYCNLYNRFQEASRAAAASLPPGVVPPPGGPS